MRSFCTGLVCSVALLHVLADANEYLSNVSEYPWANALALLGIFLMVAIKELGSMSMNHLRQHATPTPPGSSHLQVDLNASGEGTAQAHQHNLSNSHVHSIPRMELQNIDFVGKPLQRLTVYMMEGSIMIHSVLVGVAVGVLQESIAVLSLGVALFVHQFFEGLALGAVAVKNNFSFKASWHLVLTFTLSCPVGAVLGIFFSKHYDEKEYWTAWALGALNAVAAGMLLHIGLVELLPEDFGEESCSRRRRPHPLARLSALFVGCLVMAVLAIWA